MRSIRTLAAATLVASLLATPALALGQSSDPDADGSLPLARQPDGRLPLEGTPWRLASYVHGDRTGVPGPEVAAFIEFGPRFYVGSGGCSRVTGDYGVNGAALSLSPKSLAERSCAENLTIVQQAVENGLRKAAAYEIRAGATGMEDELVIYSITGVEVLRYGLDDLALLDGSEWRLESYTADGEAMAASDEMLALLSFRPHEDAYYKRRQSGPIAGSTGCNGVVAEFYRHSDVLSFSELQLTDAPCTDELAAQEAAMTAVLDATSIRLDLPYDRLILTSDDSGERLEFVSQVPLEGTTWWLASTAATGRITDLDLTLRLEEGIATGEGPCGPYSAGYVTDGAFITFVDAKGARDETCAELREERALISGLRRSVAIHRTAERLRFEDAQGRATLTFSRPFAP